MFGRILGCLICVVIGLGVVTLALIGDSMICANNVCQTQSYISKLNIKLNEDRFYFDDIKHVDCVQKSQPSRGGKKTYYLLVLEKMNGTEYSLGSYKNYQVCKDAYKPLEDYVKGKTDNVRYESEFGVANTSGMIFGILMFFIGFIILTSKPEIVEYDWDDEEDAQGS